MHSMLSNGTTNIDSITNFRDYIKAATECGIPAMGISEHGNIFEWLHKKEAIEAAGMKYLHCVEVYLTEDNEDCAQYTAIDLLTSAQLGRDISFKFRKYWQREDGAWLAIAEEHSIAENIGKALMYEPNDVKKDYIKNRDNYHCVLIAKNYDGVKELNKLVSKSFCREDFHFYYMPRISFEELFATSDNIIVTTACLGGVLNNGNPSAKERFLGFLRKNKHRCFLEIQHHKCPDQIEYNKMLYEISRTTGVPLITGTDTHALNDTHMDGRALLQKAKGVHFDNENSWDLTFKTTESLIEAYRKQKSLPMDVVYEAMNNTVAMADMVEEFKLDYSAKYPKLYEDSESVFKQKINEGVTRRGIIKLPNYQEYVDRIHYEYDTYKHNNAIDFMLLEEDYKSEMRRRNVRFGYSRGSVSGSIIAYLLGITEVDSVKYNLNFERFMNRERVSLADIDTDWLSEDRKIVKDYLYSKQGLYCCDIVTFNTIALKGAIKDICRGMFNENMELLPAETKRKIAAHEKRIAGHDARDIPVEYSAELLKEIEQNYSETAVHKEVPYKYLKFADQLIDMVEIDEKKARNKYPKIFWYVDLVINCVVSVGNHPAGCVVSPVPVDEWFGTFTTTSDEYPISVLNMKEIDSLNFVKLDILSLDNIGLIYKTCDLAGIPFLTPDNTPPDDMNVWNSIIEDTTMIFQWESQSSTAYLKQLFSDETITKIKEKNPNSSYMDLLSIGNGAIRPAGESYRDDLAQGIYQDNGHQALNDFLAPTLGYLVYQEEVIEFLHSFCGYTMGQADIVRRCIDEDSNILMANGSTKPIKDIVEGDRILSVNKDGIIKPDMVNKVYYNGKQETYRITAKHGYELIATKNHKVLTQRGWRQISDLTCDDFIMTPRYIKSDKDDLLPSQRLDCTFTCELLLKKYPIRIKSIEPCGVRRVYDLEVCDDHNYIANDIIVHNCFAKKTGTQDHLPQIKQGFKKTMRDKYGVPGEESDKLIVNFIKVIEDASSYLFSKNHADPYSWIGYICGYLRYYYPLEFITTALNIFEGKEEKSLAIINYAKKQGIKISPIKFRHSIAKYNFDKNTNEIFKGMSSIKFMNTRIADELYLLRNGTYNSFVDLLFDIDKYTSVNSRQLKILIELDFFSEFGDANYLLRQYELFESLNGKCQIKKAKAESLNLTEDQIRPYAGNETEKMFTKVDMHSLLTNIAPTLKYKPRPLKATVQSQIKHLGYVDIAEDRYAGLAAVLEIDTKYAPKLKMHSLKNGTTVECKINKKTFNKCKLVPGDLIRITGQTRKAKQKKNADGNWEPVPGVTEVWVTGYHKIENL